MPFSMGGFQMQKVTHRKSNDIVLYHDHFKSHRIVRTMNLFDLVFLSISFWIFQKNSVNE